MPCDVGRQGRLCNFHHGRLAMRILVTGGAGFIGSHTVERLLAEGHHVSILDNFSTGKRENLPAKSGLSIFEGDIRDRDIVRTAVVGMDAVLHLAAQVSVQSSLDNPVVSSAHNISGFINVLDSSFRAKAGRFVYASSAAVYGMPKELPLNEGSPVNTISPYGLEKLIDDQYAQLYCKLYSFPTFGLRYFNVYGPRQDASSPYAGVISKFIRALRAGRPLTIFGNGKQTRDFIFVGDIAKINTMALTGIKTGICNVGTGNSVTLLEMVSALAQVSDRTPRIEFEPAVMGDIQHSSMNSERLREIFGTIDLIPLADGLRKLWEAECSV